MSMTVKPITPSEAGPEVKPIYDRVKAKYMIVPIFFQAIAQVPHLLASYVRQIGLEEKGVSLPASLIDLIHYATAQEFSCSYCTGSAMMTLRINGYSERAISALKGRSEAMEFDAKTRRLLSFARLLARNPERVTASEIGELRAAGFSDEAIISAAALVAASGFTTRITGVLRIEPDGIVSAANSPLGRRLLIPFMRLMMRRGQPPAEAVPA